MSVPPDPICRPGKLWLYTEPIRWQYDGLQPISLWQLMDYFSSHDFMKAIRDVYGYELELKPRVEETGDWRTEITDWDKKQANELLEKVRKSFPSKDFPQTSAAITRVYAVANSWCHFQDLYIRIVGLRETMEDELRDRKAVLVPNLKADYCDKERLFGDEVFGAFTSAQSDIQNGGNCYALGLYTACVFHMMRALEAGLQALANDIPVTWTNDPWGQNLKIIKDAVQALHS